MLSMGITLTPKDFVKVAARPNATLMHSLLALRNDASPRLGRNGFQFGPGPHGWYGLVEH
jgi:hypothetical protein